MSGSIRADRLACVGGLMPRGRQDLKPGSCYGRSPRRQRRKIKRRPARRRLPRYPRAEARVSISRLKIYRAARRAVCPGALTAAGGARNAAKRSAAAMSGRLEAQRRCSMFNSMLNAGSPRGRSFWASCAAAPASGAPPSRCPPARHPRLPSTTHPAARTRRSASRSARP